MCKFIFTSNIFSSVMSKAVFVHFQIANKNLFLSVRVRTVYSFILHRAKCKRLFLLDMKDLFYTWDVVNLFLWCLFLFTLERKIKIWTNSKTVHYLVQALLCSTAESDSFFYEMCKCIFTSDLFSSWYVRKLLNFIASVFIYFERMNKQLLWD